MIVAAGRWLRGHDILTGLALSVLFLMAVFKIAFALVARHRGGWSPGAAFGGKLAAPDRDLVAITGDGFYMFATAIHSLWSAAQYNAPYLTIVYQNRSYSTGTLRVARTYPDGYAAKAGYPGGYFEPPIDFANEASSDVTPIVTWMRFDAAISRNRSRSRSTIALLVMMEMGWKHSVATSRQRRVMQKRRSPGW